MSRRNTEFILVLSLPTSYCVTFPHEGRENRMWNRPDAEVSVAGCGGNLGTRQSVSLLRTPDCVSPAPLHEAWAV